MRFVNKAESKFQAKLFSAHYLPFFHFEIVLVAFLLAEELLVKMMLTSHGCMLSLNSRILSVRYFLKCCDLMCCALIMLLCLML